MKRFALCAVLLLVTLPAFGDSFNVFAVQNNMPGNGGTQFEIQLTPNGNPLLHNPDPIGFGLTFDVQNVFSSTFDVQVFETVIVGGQTFANGSVSGNICPNPQPCRISVGAILASFPQPTQGSITLIIDGQAESFNFRYTSAPISAVPEPTSFIFVATGLAGIGWRRLRAIGRANR